MLDSLGGRLGLPATFITPAGSVFHDPIEKSTLKTDVMTGLFAFDPLVAQDFLTLRQKLLIQHGILDQIGAFSSLGIHFTAE